MHPLFYHRALKQLPSQSVERGIRYAQEDRVALIEQDESGCSAEVQGSRSQPYEVALNFKPDGGIVGVCSCPIGIGCKHVAAVLSLLAKRPLTVAESSSAPYSSAIKAEQPDPALSLALQWLAETPEPAPEGKPEEHVRYLLSAEDWHGPVKLTLVAKLFHRLKSGKWSAPHRYDYSVPDRWRKAPAYLQPVDHQIAQLLWAGNYYRTDASELPDETGALLLQLLAQSGRCHLEAFDGPLLRWGEPLPLRLEWQSDDDGGTRPQAVAGTLSPILCAVLPFSSPCYLDRYSAIAGPADSRWPAPRLTHLLQATALPVTVWRQLAEREPQRWRELNLLLPDERPPQVIEANDWWGELQQSASDWFQLELGVMVDGEKISLLPLLVDAIRQTPADYRLEALADKAQLLLPTQDGRYLALPTERLRPILAMLTELFEQDAPLHGPIQLPVSHAPRLAEWGELPWSGGERLRELAARLHNFHDIAPLPAPAGFHAKLRNYQQQGLGWLQFLREHGLHGILADDMGLGKTVQALAHILTEKAAGRLDRPCLVVAPTSLMFNWQREAARYTPQLQVLLLHGTDRQRRFDRLGQADLVLTTYPLLARDHPILSAQPWHLLILDEAQAVKNPKSQAAQIVRTLNARHRLCLTGTPMENHLGELWALFDFLMPGLLGSESQFNRLFRSPIEKQDDQERRQLLARRIAPFLLRRRKSEVANELPPKTEIVREAELTGAQRDLYETVRLALHEKVRKEVAAKGFKRSQIVILDALLKLREVCCDPRLSRLEPSESEQPSEAARSAKLELLMQLLPELVEEGRRILLFSSFTRMLALIEQELQTRGIGYVKLTGQTRDRETPVTRFQAGEVPVFLISLKAGGSGLNLTAADTVIHYDPWWNPAAEEQATDRAYRIGQDKPVFVYRLLCQGTVEEKMQALKARKQALAAGIYDEADGAGTALSADDLSQLFAPLDTAND
jgi:superfamily II DNA or RNA helicase